MGTTKGTSLKRMLVTGAALTAMMATAGVALAGDVTVTLMGVEKASGPLYVSLQTEEQFMLEEAAYGEKLDDPKAGATSVIIADVEDGDYSVSVWHDIDGDGVFDRNEYGIPLDGWAMSGDLSMQRPPTFEETRITVNGGAEVTLDMVYAPK